MAPRLATVSPCRHAAAPAPAAGPWVLRTRALCALPPASAWPPAHQHARGPSDRARAGPRPPGAVRVPAARVPCAPRRPAPRPGSTRLYEDPDVDEYEGYDDVGYWRREVSRQDEFAAQHLERGQVRSLLAPVAAAAAAAEGSRGGPMHRHRLRAPGSTAGCGDGLTLAGWSGAGA
jgi:hypothetical protein